MAKWVVVVLRKGDPKSDSSVEYSNYVDAKQAFDKVEQVSDEEKDSATGRVWLKSDSGVTFNMGYIA